MFDLITSKDSNVKNDVLSGITVALALVPEAVAFAFVAGVEPMIGLYAAFMMGLITSAIGGRPGMISGATGAMAVVKTHHAETWQMPVEMPNLALHLGLPEARITHRFLGRDGVLVV